MCDRILTVTLSLAHGPIVVFVDSERTCCQLREIIQHMHMENLHLSRDGQIDRRDHGRALTGAKRLSDRMMKNYSKWKHDMKTMSGHLEKGMATAAKRK